MNKVSATLLLLLCVCFPGHSQKAPVKFGDVSMDELKITSTYMDSSAPAVVLYDYGVFRAAEIKFTRIVRIKILKKEGYNFANWSFEGDIKSNIKGLTSNLENGKIIQDKLKSESIFRTRILDDYYTLRAAMPNVKVGSVIDIEFTYDGLPREWRFQEDIPVIYSELILEQVPQVTFRTNISGHEKLTYSSPNRWIAKYMPAFKDEPYNSGKENYITKLKIDLAQVGWRGLSSSWSKINELLAESSYFGMPSTNTGFLTELSNELSGKYKDKEALLRAAYDAIRQRIVWNDIVKLTLVDGNIASVYKLKVGNSAEINLLLYKLLKKLDFDVYPVALSTKDNGEISTYSPSIEQLNYAISYVKLGDKEYFLDATEKYMPLSLLPLRCMNVQGRLVDKKKDIWLTLANNKKDKDITIYNLSLDPDHKLQGDISFLRYDYSAFNFRKAFSKFNSNDEYVEHFQNEMPGMRIKNLSFENLDSVYMPVSEKLDVEIQNQVSQSDNSLYLIPGYFATIRENPFKLNERKYPIDFGVPVEKTEIFNLTVPAGYSNVILPKTVVMKLPDNSAVFMYEAVFEDNHVRLTTKFSINKTTFSVEEYNDLKEFYNQIIKKQMEPMIIKKNETI